MMGPYQARERSTDEQEYQAFCERVRPRLEQALLVRFGPDRADEGMAEALSYGWEHWSRIRDMENPAGYLYRVACTGAQQHATVRETPLLVAPQPTELPEIHPDLVAALNSLTERQRTAVVLNKGFGWTAAEVAEYLEIARPTAESHIERAMDRLREILEDE